MRVCVQRERPDRPDREQRAARPDSFHGNLRYGAIRARAQAACLLAATFAMLRASPARADRRHERPRSRYRAHAARLRRLLRHAGVWPLVERAYGEPQRLPTLAHLAELFAHLAPYRGPAVAGHRGSPCGRTISSTRRRCRRMRTTKRSARNGSCRSRTRVATQPGCTRMHRTCPLPATWCWRRSRTGCLTGSPSIRNCSAPRNFLDADLAILAAAPDRLREYDRAIAREWAQDPDAPSAAFRAGRRQRSNICARRPRCFDRRNSRRSSRTRNAISTC